MFQAERQLAIAFVAVIVATSATFVGAIAQPRYLAPPSPFVSPWGELDPYTAFDARPNGADFARHYPRNAMDRGFIGVAVLCCKAKPDRALDCRSGAEWPNSWGFGEASVALGPKFRLTQAAYDIVSAHPDAELRIPIRWQFTSLTRKGRDAIGQASDVMSRAPLCRGEVPRVPVS